MPGRRLEVLFAGLAIFALISTLFLHHWLPIIIPVQRTGSQTKDNAYQSAPVEEIMMKHLGSLGYNTNGNETSSGCEIWHRNPSAEPKFLNQIAQGLQEFRTDLREYAKLINEFEGVEDLRQSIGTSEDICKTVELHENGLMEIGRASCRERC